MIKKLLTFIYIILIVLVFSNCKDELVEPMNRAPQIDSLGANPSSIVPNGQTTLTCVATDKDGDELSINWKSVSGTFPNGNEGFEVIWQAPNASGTFTITAIVSDGSLTDSDSIIVGTAPSPPTLFSPINGEIDMPITTTLTWNKSNDAISYVLEVSTNNQFTNIIFNQSSITGTSRQITGLNYLTTYYWRVNTTNSYGTSTWSEVWNFTTIGIAPQPPTLSSPTNGATNLSIPVILIWNPSNNATGYDLEISLDNQFHYSGFVLYEEGITETSFTVELNNATTYYWRILASNSYGYSNWSSIRSFTTSIAQPCPGIPDVTYANKTYTTVKIGGQCWLKENLDVGTMIQGNQDATNNGVIEKYCYNNDPNNCNTYGGLYQWSEAMQYSTTPGTQGICPPGWHIPSQFEFETLRSVVWPDGNTLKAIGQGSGNGAGTNKSGFTALLAGLRFYTNDIFYQLNYYARFWSSDELGNSASHIYLEYDSDGVGISGSEKENGLSVRCIKD